MSIDKMRRRPNIPQEWPASPSETEAAWSNRLVTKGAEYGVYRQCSIGWHAECSQRYIVGDACPCRCECHMKPESLAEAINDPEGVQLAAAAAALAPTWSKEWGIRWEEFGSLPDWTKMFGSEKEAREKLAGSAFPGVIVSRVIGPWTEARS